MQCPELTMDTSSSVERKLIIIVQRILTMLKSTVGLWFIQTAKYWEGWHITNSQTPSSAFRGQLTNQPADTCGRGTLVQAPGWLACTGVPKGEGVHSWAVGKLQNNFSLVTGLFIEKDGQIKCVNFTWNVKGRSRILISAFGDFLSMLLEFQILMYKIG